MFLPPRRGLSVPIAVIRTKKPPLHVEAGGFVMQGAGTAA